MKWGNVNRRLCILASMILLLSVSASAAESSSVVESTSGDEKTDKGARIHDGFFFRGLAGGIYSKLERENFDGSEDLLIRGPGVISRFQIGWSLVNNFILHAECSGAWMKNPEMYTGSNGKNFGTIYGEERTMLSISEYGIGGCFYFMPANFYVDVALTAPQLFIKVNSEKGKSKRGRGINLSLGKEWWVSDNWGIGVALIASVYQVKSGYGNDSFDSTFPPGGVSGNYWRFRSCEENQKINGGYLGLAFSVTYN